MSNLLIAVAVVATLLTVGWFFTTRQVPETGASHEGFRQVEPATTSDTLYAGSDRPAGPDAETTDPGALGGDQSPPR